MYYCSLVLWLTPFMVPSIPTNKTHTRDWWFGKKKHRIWGYRYRHLTGRGENVNTPGVLYDAFSPIRPVPTIPQFCGFVFFSVVASLLSFSCYGLENFLKSVLCVFEYFHLRYFFFCVADQQHRIDGRRATTVAVCSTYNVLEVRNFRIEVKMRLNSMFYSKSYTKLSSSSKKGSSRRASGG